MDFGFGRPTDDDVSLSCQHREKLPTALVRAPHFLQLPSIGFRVQHLGGGLGVPKGQWQFSHEIYL